MIGRHDLVLFINKIQCTKRRHAYKLKLDSLLKVGELPKPGHPDVPTDATFVPYRSLQFQIRLLSGNKPSKRVNPLSGCHGEIGRYIDLIKEKR